MSAPNAINRHLAGPGFITLYPEPTPRNSENRAGDPLPASWFSVRITARWPQTRPSPVRALAAQLYPPPDSGLCPVGRCATYSEYRAEFDVWGEHAAFVLAAIQRTGPSHLRIDTVSR